MSDYQKKQFDGHPGDTVFFDRMYERTQHLYVVLTPPEGSPPMAAVVNLTSQKSYSDTTVVLQQGDHPFIDRATVVNYGGAHIVNVERLKQEIDKEGTAGYPFEPEILKTIQDGIQQSPFTPRGIKKYCAGRLAVGEPNDPGKQGNGLT